jgi:hypothetical protein
LVQRKTSTVSITNETALWSITATAKDVSETEPGNQQRQQRDSGTTF